ncbi:sugar ABC transporter substrate-binding protein, partial [Streptomyces sp. NPDC006356]
MPGMSRRTVLRSVAAGGAAAAVPGLLTACSTSSGDSDVSNAGKELAPWPAYKAAAGPRPDLAPTDAGVQAGYTSYPADLVKSVPRTPGDGSTVKVMSVSFGTPPKPASANRFWAAVENALGVKIEYTIISQADYQKKMATVMAGDADTLPDIINLFSGFVLPREAEFVQRRAEDLTPFLSGEAVSDYPNLAGIPTHAWRDMGRIAGRLYGIPLERPLPGSTLWLNQGMFADAGMKEGWTADDFAAAAKRATSGRTYALGAANGSLFGNAVHSAAHNAPQNWAVTKDGTFLPACADERYKASIAFQ